MREPREVTHEIQPLTEAERVRYAGRLCRKSCAAPITVVCLYRYKSAGWRGESVVTHPRCVTHGTRWAELHGLTVIGQAS